MRHHRPLLTGLGVLTTALLTALVLLLGTGVSGAAVPAGKAAVGAASGGQQQRCSEDVHETPKRSEYRGECRETSPGRRTGPHWSGVGGSRWSGEVGTVGDAPAARHRRGPRHVPPPGESPAVLQVFRC